MVRRCAGHGRTECFRALLPSDHRQTLQAMEAPEVRFARSGEVSIAFSVLGDGPFDLVFVSG